MKNTNRPTKSEVARVLDFLMESQSEGTAIFIDKHTMDIDYDVLTEDVPTECTNGTDFCEILEKQKGFKFGNEKQTKTMKSWSIKFVK
jgi:hypothetical protein